MDEHLARIFHMQIWLQCKFAQRAYGELEQALTDLSASREGQQSEYGALADLPHDKMHARAVELGLAPSLPAWCAIQALLTATANISKALWGQSGRYSTERQLLRDALSVSDDSVLAQTSMRNNFDHFDERLADWWATSQSHNYADLNFGNMATAIDGIPVGDIFRSYDVSNGDLVFWGNVYNLRTIMAEINRITPLAMHQHARL